ncbi:hypothetical protein KQI84_18535 [bacterium]|nr:hypothetical protein [bacterium]
MTRRKIAGLIGAGVVLSLVSFYFLWRASPLASHSEFYVFSADVYTEKDPWAYHKELVGVIPIVKSPKGLRYPTSFFADGAGELSHRGHLTLERPLFFTNGWTFSGIHRNEEVGFVVYETEKAKETARVCWISNDQLDAAIEAEKIILPKTSTLPPFDLDQLPPVSN